MLKKTPGLLKIKLSILCLLVTFLATSCASSKQSLSTVETLNYNKYLGKWYEIARIPNSFEKGMYCVTATYSLKKNGKKIRVINEGYVEGKKAKLKTAKGTARVPNALRPGELKVSFFFPFSGDYFIIHLDEDNYQYALVGSPSRDYLWILSRTPQLNESTYDRLVKIAAENGFNVKRLIKREQNCGN